MDKISIIVMVKNDDVIISVLINIWLFIVCFWEIIVFMLLLVCINGSLMIVCLIFYVKNVKIFYFFFVVSVK